MIKTNTFFKFYLYNRYYLLIYLLHINLSDECHFLFTLHSFGSLIVLLEKRFASQRHANLNRENKNCWFSVSRHSKQIKIKMKNRSIDKVQNLGNERRYMCKDPR